MVDFLLDLLQIPLEILSNAKSRWSTFWFWLLMAVFIGLTVYGIWMLWYRD